MRTLIRAFGAVVQILMFIAAFAVLGAVIWSAWLVASLLPAILQDTKPEVIISVAGGLGAFILHITERTYSKARDIAEAHRPRKVECYTKFVGRVCEFLQNHSKIEDPKQKAKMTLEVATAIEEFMRESILWASPSVIQEYSEFKAELNVDSTNAMVLFDDLLKAIRVDLGHSNRRLKRGDLIKVFLKNPSELDARLKLT